MTPTTTPASELEEVSVGVFPSTENFESSNLSGSGTFFDHYACVCVQFGLFSSIRVIKG